MSWDRPGSADILQLHTYSTGRGCERQGNDSSVAPAQPASSSTRMLHDRGKTQTLKNQDRKLPLSHRTEGVSSHNNHYPSLPLSSFHFLFLLSIYCVKIIAV